MISDQTTILVTFGCYLLVMFGIGWLAWRQTKNLTDYILGGRKLGRWTTALSAGASDMSGWLLLGLPGYAYVAGFEAVWIAVGLLVGTWLNWLFIAPRLRESSEKYGNSITIPGFLANHFDDRSHILRIVSAFFILLFFIFYTSSGLVAGGKLFESVFNLPYTWAVVAGTVAILIYTTFGGFLAVSWTDLFQGLLMAFALVLVSAISIKTTGGWTAMIETMDSINPALTNLFNSADGKSLGIIAIISLLGWGLGYFGQPHILVRFMAIRSHQLIPAARRIAVTWTAVSLIAALLIGYTGLTQLDVQLAGSASERVFIEMVALLFHPIPAGICLAAILAAIMSTADSQLLVASSACTEDFYQTLFSQNATQDELVSVGRITVVIIAIIALFLSLQHEQKVLELVAYAWAGFGAAFGPVILLSLYWKKMTHLGAVSGIVIGSTVVIVWHNLHGGIFELYELIPGFLMAAAASIFTSLSKLQLPNN